MSFVTRWFTSDDVAAHDKPYDCWVSKQGLVLDLSDLIKENFDQMGVKNLIENAGKDISHWFADDGDLKYLEDPGTGIPVPYWPRDEPLLHAPPLNPSSATPAPPELPWWKDKSYIIGRLSKKTIRIRILNTLTKDSTELLVPTEETLREVLQRYKYYNRNIHQYVCKYEGDILQLEKTLIENGIPYLEDDFERLDYAEDDIFVPGIMLLFDDKLIEEHLPFEVDYDAVL
ncbi:Cytochrome b5-like Heme/Steroid binding domain containing protein [Aduncisulcus paluster]|uniref:Cytochrome b5-like Heme/Steroid binding domain containing protein n=1 Tax=Aduncisulcus paluster TaxID=2918883 RepID=A0ABQ5KVX0_9EUKA|nr:Cytochrome b5-like Heme/Steroid binding domain containing protein [Aduncisulcus paluster]